MPTDTITVGRNWIELCPHDVEKFTLQNKGGYNILLAATTGETPQSDAAALLLAPGHLLTSNMGYSDSNDVVELWVGNARADIKRLFARCPAGYSCPVFFSYTYLTYPDADSA
ncbi:hypothetical protein AL036_16340 [Salipiger aestuarii]|uniref:hypothetical protein n=1 Tax=Salipiger aestuarii TaxID=568098 RepID=UPI001239F1B7|nr:hypothetical protein [Salipiger aestuarii]KAA8606018.1 hypothetical protein AL036_16340 [Salipiger aestuarii]